MKTSLLKQNAAHFKTLGHTKRLEIVCLLHGHKLTVNQIVQMTALRQAAVSQHLMFLKREKIVVTKKIGKEVYYSLSPKPFINLSDFTKSLSRLVPISKDEPTVIDPVCHMHLTPGSARYTTSYNGVRHYFCGKGCLQEFHAHH